MSAKGTPAFIAVRASAVVLLLLALWFVFGLLAHAGGGYQTARAWLAAPLNAGLLAATLVVAAFHMRLGMNEIIEDYIHGALAGVLRIVNALAAAAVAAAALYSAYRLAFAG